ncbi:MAG: hypothetical protein CL927_09320 [Deltaproteobacteria bacterium]|nr:hypothetical protein [Deltaproteobacteria bacterium]HCH66257.1 hypothetical protein [Deltaproteobacteria bacterium]
MSSQIPEPVLRADEAHHEVLREVLFSRHLNPLNSSEARHRFAAGEYVPPFRYLPLRGADQILRRLDEAQPPRDHPAGALVGACVDATWLLVRALRDRTATAFHALAMSGGWYPDPATLSLSFPESHVEASPVAVAPFEVILRLRTALVERGLLRWQVVEDTVMAARVLVDGAKRVLRVNPHAVFRERDIERLVVHEIDVHAFRSENGARQRLYCFQSGLPGSLGTEEGLAMVSEEISGHSAPGVLNRQVEVVRAIDRARVLGFRELYDELSERVGPNLAWGICVRIKRGLGRPGQPGVYAKDSVYLTGRMKVREWLDAGGDVVDLYVGKVSVDSPISTWRKQGWVRTAPIPPTWKTYLESKSTRAKESAQASC